MKFALIAVLIAGASLFASTSAQALTTGQCSPAADVRAELAAEKQQTIILGNRSGSGHPTTLAFTSNADGSKGYMLLGDEPVGTQAVIICVQSVYRDIRLNDVTKPGVPSWAKRSVDPKRVAELCDGGHLGYQGTCMRQDESLANLERNGQRVLFKAIGTAMNPQGNAQREDQLIYVTLEPKEAIGLIDATTVEGAAYMLWAYSKVSLTQYAAALTK